MSIDNRREVFRIEGRKWLYVEMASILDIEGLQVYHLPSNDGPRGAVLFIAFSPDHRKMARYDSYDTYEDDRNILCLAIIENDIAGGQIRSFNIDDKTMWFETSGDTDQHRPDCRGGS